MPHCIQKPIELILQSHEFQFIERSDINMGWFTAYSSFEKREPGKARPYRLFPDGSFYRIDLKTLRREVKDERQRSKILKKSHDLYSLQKLAQEITTIHISDDGLYATDEGPEQWPDRMYLKIPRTLSTEDATSLLIKKYFFCYFPYGNEIVALRNHPKNDPHLKKSTPQNKLHAINELHLYRKILRLTNIIKNIETVTKEDHNFLREEVRNNVFEIRVSMNEFAYREIRDFENWENKNIKDTIYNPEDENWENGVKGYRVFGHFALCCFELLADIEQEYFERFCKYTLCQKPLPYGIHKGIKTCSPDCRRLYRNEQKRIGRAK